MKVSYSRLVRATGFGSLNYWQYFGTRLADLAEIPEGAAVLDVGTGSGSVLIPAAERVAGSGLAIGIDLNRGVLRSALPGIKKHTVKNTALAQMDAGNLGFIDGQFDFVLSGFVGWSDCFDFTKLDFTGPDTRLAEISRVLKVGGWVGISSWVSQEDLDWLGIQFQRHMPDYSAEQGIGSAWMAYSKENASGLERILGEGNFQDIKITTETEVFVSTDEQAWWQQVWGAGWWVHIDRLAPDKLMQFKEKVFENLQEHKQNDGIHFSKTVLFAFGRKKV